MTVQVVHYIPSPARPGSWRLQVMADGSIEIAGPLGGDEKPEPFIIEHHNGSIVLRRMEPRQTGFDHGC